MRTCQKTGAPELPPARRWLATLLPLALVLVSSACVGLLSDVDDDADDDDGAASDSSSSSSGGPDSGATTVGPTTRFARLTHAQYDRTVADLFDLGADAPTFSADFRSDASSGSYPYDNDSVVLGLDQGLHRAYERAAAAIADMVMADPAIFDRVVPVEGSDAERAHAFITSFGERVHRRPLTDEQVDGYLALYELGLTGYADAPGFEGGIRMVLEAFFVSPYFLYRVELSSDEVDGMVPLDDWEIATRLSYTLWDTMPDSALFGAARDGRLADGSSLGAEVERMLDDPKAATLFARVHSQALGVARYTGIRPDPVAFPDVPADLSELATAELAAVLQDAYATGRTWEDVLTEPRTFVNAELAAIYGISGDFGDELVEVSLDPTERIGVFTSVGFLASNATSVNPDPIHRGLLVSQKLLCNRVSAPPGDIPPLPVPQADQTNREVIEELTEVAGSDCAGCHTNFINPLGFPFEGFDASGAVRLNDRGLPLDLVTSPLVEGELVQVDGPIELISELASREVVYRCYGEHLTTYLMGRNLASDDEQLTDRIAEAAFSGASLRDVLAAAVTSPQFTHRRPEP